MQILINKSIIKMLFLKSKKRLNIFSKLTLRSKGLLIEAIVLMGIARLAVLVFPFRKIASRLGTQMGESPSKVDTVKHSKAIQIGWLIEKSSRYTPWESKCLVQALTAQYMLKRRSIPSTLYLGMAKEGANKLLAHAWLRCGEVIITGDNERSMFKTVVYFASNPDKSQ